MDTGSLYFLDYGQGRIGVMNIDDIQILKFKYIVSEKDYRPFGLAIQYNSGYVQPNLSELSMPKELKLFSCLQSCAYTAELYQSVTTLSFEILIKCRLLSCNKKAFRNKSASCLYHIYIHCIYAILESYIVKFGRYVYM